MENLTFKTDAADIIKSSKLTDVEIKQLLEIQKSSKVESYMRYLFKPKQPGER